MNAGPKSDERRLGDRILHALELALDEEDLEVSEHLARALEETLTRFGGAGRTERRGLPAGMLDAFERLDRLRHRSRTP
ncbi:hypothetical protein [Azospirillum sp. ST 5-10]|uniref:hypothetical protein n=1 Tax=unclassified Azospirillum TaxID=2630922 RepID=UPI003F4A5D9E